MMLRNRNLQNQSENTNVKGEKRHSKAAAGDAAIEPKPKRAAFTDISKVSLSACQSVSITLFVGINN